MDGVVLSGRAERDVRRIGPRETVARLRDALWALAAGNPDLDVRPLVGSEPWQRLRVGDYRVLFRPIDPTEVAAPGARWLVARIVHRRDLGHAVSTLS